MIRVLHSRVVGPLEPYAVGFADDLVRLGYLDGTRSGLLGLVAHLSRWMTAHGIDADGLSPGVVEAYVGERRDAGYHAFRSVKALVPLLDYLRGLGVVGLPPDSPGTPGQAMLRDFQRYLVAERGMGEASARGYRHQVAGFVELYAGYGEALASLDACAVTSFLVEQSGRWAPKTLQRTASAMRALLRWWHVRGLIGADLVGAVPKVAYRTAGLPQGLNVGQSAALMASCDRGTTLGMRDFAMFTLMMRAGLRAGEVAALTLDDIDWRGGRITVSGKPGRCDRLPLSMDVGEAIAIYLQHGRPRHALDRHVFIRVKAPHRGLSATGVTQAVGDAAKRAGLGVIHAHRLRHTAATSMPAAGASLAEIGQVLRHRGPLTTSIYAKVDLAALRPLARPWPTGDRS